MIHRIELVGDFLEKLAEATHEVFCDELRAKGYRYGSKTSEKKKEHSSLKLYTKLSEDEKEQNRGFVRDIPNKLTHAGLTMLPTSTGRTSDKLCSEQVEIMARLEHERWMKQKRDAGWEYAEKTDKKRKLHKDLVPWEKLTEEEKEKDRVLVRNVPRILAKAGYSMVKLG